VVDLETSAQPRQALSSTDWTAQFEPFPGQWQIVPLAEVVEFTRKPRALNPGTYEQVPFIPMEAIRNDGSPDCRFTLKPGVQISSGVYCEPGDILLAKITPSLENGKQGTVPHEVPNGFAYATTEVYPLKARTGCLVPDFLFALLRHPSLRAELAGKLEGSTGRQRLPKHVLANLSIPLPPLPEQRAIAHVLRTVQRAREATERVIAATRELKKSLMRHLFTYGPVPVDQVDQVRLKETEIGPVPEHWKVVKLGEVCEKPQYGCRATASPNPVGPKFLRISDIQDERVNWEAVPYCALPAEELGGCQLIPGDIVVARIGATTGKSYLIKDCPTAVFASYLIRIRTKSLLTPSFLGAWMKTDSYWGQINSNKGGRLKLGVNAPVLKALQMPLPLFDEQADIARLLERADRKLEIEESRKLALDSLFTTLLHHLMTGKVRVE